MSWVVRDLWLEIGGLNFYMCTLLVSYDDCIDEDSVNCFDSHDA